MHGGGLGCAWQVGMCGRGMHDRGCVWWRTCIAGEGACVAGWHAWWVVCVVGAICGGGECVAGRACVARGHV